MAPQQPPMSFHKITHAIFIMINMEAFSGNTREVWGVIRWLKKKKIRVVFYCFSLFLTGPKRSEKQINTCGSICSQLLLRPSRRCFNMRVLKTKRLGTTASNFNNLIQVAAMWLSCKASVQLGRQKKVVLTFTSVIAISTTLPTTIKASNVFQASAK